MTINPATLTVTEGDASGVSYTVVLTSQPAGDVTVAISGHASTDLTLSGTTLSGDDELTFTTENWGTAQTVTVKAAEDRRRGDGRRRDPDPRHQQHGRFGLQRPGRPVRHREHHRRTTQWG